MNFKIIRYVLSWVLKIEAICMLLPLICSFVYKEETVGVWLLCIAICFSCGFLLCSKSPKDKTMYIKDGFVSVALSWILLSFFGALPIYFSNAIPNFTDALFETISGFTTTGASVIKDLDIIPKSIIFWRSFSHWIGGMGVLVFLVALLPLTGSSNFYLIKAESPGPSVGKLVPKVRSTAKILYLIYISLTILQIILLLFGGMKFFDAVTISLGTAGTGGFGISNAGLGVYSNYCQGVITVFMIIFGVDFSIYYLILLGKVRSVLKSDELRMYFGLVLVSIILITLNSYSVYKNIYETFRYSSFHVASIISTTGYTTYDYNTWPEFSKTILLILTFFGACAGSTAGGIKISRILIMLKSIAKEVRIIAHPKSTIKIKMNGRMVEHETIRSVNVYMISYLAIFLTSLLVISFDNFDFTTNFTSVATTLGNVGPGLSLVGPMGNFSIFSPLSKIIFMINMLIGRLEIFPILLLIFPRTWKK